jgi:hypothetical protein
LLTVVIDDREGKYTPQFLKAVEEASVPWRDPDGRTYYRIRAGLVTDNVRSTWPCKYKLPIGYERHYFVREERRKTNTAMECVAGAVAESAARAAFVDALQEWSVEFGEAREAARGVTP